IRTVSLASRAASTSRGRWTLAALAKREVLVRSLRSDVDWDLLVVLVSDSAKGSSGNVRRKRRLNQGRQVTSGSQVPRNAQIPTANSTRRFSGFRQAEAGGEEGYHVLGQEVEFEVHQFAGATHSQIRLGTCVRNNPDGETRAVH